MFPWPAAFTFLNGKCIKLCKSRYQKGPPWRWPLKATSKVGEPGTIVEINKEGWISVAAKDSCIQILEVQSEGKRCMKAFDWANGQRIKIGDIFCAAN